MEKGERGEGNKGEKEEIVESEEEERSENIILKKVKYVKIEIGRGGGLEIRMKGKKGKRREKCTVCKKSKALGDK